MASKILDTLLADIKEAMNARDTSALSALRSLHAQIKDATVNAGKEETDDVVISGVGGNMMADAIGHDGGKEFLQHLGTGFLVIAIFGVFHAEGAKFRSKMPDIMQ